MEGCKSITGAGAYGWIPFFPCYCIISGESKPVQTGRLAPRFPCISLPFLPSSWRRPQGEITMTNDAIAYIRVSSEEQADSGLGLEAQRQRIAAYCTMKGLQLAEE